MRNGKNNSKKSESGTSEKANAYPVEDLLTAYTQGVLPVWKGKGKVLERVGKGKRKG
jgi:hypothetical protein